MSGIHQNPSQGSSNQEVLNAIITASAGSGKTYQLVRRYLSLLALGESPESIVAMTFTRKAAQEFFERILQKLADLAVNPEAAKGYVDGLTKQGKALRLLRGMIDAMDRLKLGTIDSFFASVTRCFPFELGLSRTAKVMDEDESASARQEVLQDLLMQFTGAGKEQALSQMLEAWKGATMGRELNSPVKYLTNWFDQLHPFYLEQRDHEAWGGVDRIWKNKSSMVHFAQANGGDAKLKALVEQLQDSINPEAWGRSGEKKWPTFFACVLARRPGEPIESNDKLGREISYMLSADRGNWKQLRHGERDWKINRSKAVLELEAANALADLLEIMVGRELLIHAQRTQWRWKLVSVYEDRYRKLVRGAGRLAFEDLTWLLAQQAESAEQQERLEELRREWEYRLDSQYRHWMFDEFQDTSRLQWTVLENLVDEAASDPEGRRSFFVVGDLKQSLYMFRQAEPQLFLDVMERYANTRMEQTAPLTTSFRSCRSVLNMVNDVFLKVQVARWYEDSMQWWRYEAHQSADTVADLPGCGALLTVGSKTYSVLGPEGEIQEEDKRAAKLRLLTSLIAEIDPLSRGMSCAVLTRTNSEAEALSAELRSRLNMEVVCESKVHAGTDNPLSHLLMSVLKFAVHPGDTMAREHILMSPLAKWMQHEEWKLGDEVRRQLSREGFLAVIRCWEQRIREGMNQEEWDPFTAMRLTQILDIAAECDEAGNRDVDDFIATVQGLTVSGVEQSQALQVMTFHKSKGLEFDVVIMPEIQKTALDSANHQGEHLIFKRDEHGNLVWLLEQPQSIWRSQDETLIEIEKVEKARIAYQGLCRLYVGMTRAKRGLYVLMDELKGNRLSEAELLKATLSDDGENPLEQWCVGGETHRAAADCWYLNGDRYWYRTVPVKEKTAEVEEATHETQHEPSLGELWKKMKKPVTRKSPSGQEAFHVTGGELLTDQREKGRLLGLMVHELFSTVNWLEDGGVDAVKEKWLARNCNRRPGFDDAAELVLRCLQDKTIAAWFVNSGAGTTSMRDVWCERSFDFFDNGDWVSGVIDRVVFEVDASGRKLSATVLDFKTDGVADEARLKSKVDGYRPQLKLYAEAVSKLTGLPLDKVRTGLIFVQLPRLVWL